MGLNDYYFDLQQMNIGAVPNKKVCINHFFEANINNFIRKNYNDGYCDYCQKEKKVLDLEEILIFMMKGISNFFEDAANFQPYESRNGGYLWGTSTVEELMDNTGVSAEPYELIEDIIASIEEIGWCSYYDYYNSPGEELEERWKFFTKITKNHTRYFFKFNKENRSYPDNSFSAENALLDLGSLIKKFNLYSKISPATNVFRGRQHAIKDSKKLQDISELVSPKVEDARYANRFSPSGIPMFYGGLSDRITISEIYNSGNKSKKRITIGKFRVKEEIRVIDLSKVPTVPGIFQPDRFHNYFDLLFLNNLIDDITKPVKLDKFDHIEYVPTQIVTEFLRYSFNNQIRKKVHGIIYPSAKNKNEKCIVFFWDQDKCIEKLELLNTACIRTKDI